MELSPAGFEEMLTDLSYMDSRTGIAFLKLWGYLRRFGSAPTGERAFASILGVTIRRMNEVVWPLLEVRLELSEDGKRYTSPDITGGKRRSGIPAAPVPQAKSLRHQVASRVRWAGRERRQAEAAMHAAMHASMHEGRMQPDAKMDAFSTTDACGFASADASPHASDASVDASDASALHARPLSLSEASLLSSSLQTPEDSLGESERARASAAGASLDAPRMQTDATMHASGDASRMQTDASADASANASSDASEHADLGGPGSQPRRPKHRHRGLRVSAAAARTRMTPDWAPAAADEAFARDLGNHPATIAGAFRDHYLANGEIKLDWSAAFRGWCRRQLTFGPMVMPGGKADPPAADAADAAHSAQEEEEAPIVGSGPDAQWARVRRELKREAGPVVWRTWLADMVFAGVDGDEVRLLLTEQFKRDWVLMHYGGRLTTLWRAEISEIRRATIDVGALRAVG